MGRKPNLKQKQRRIETLLILIDEHPEAIQLNIRKLLECSQVSRASYQILYRSWREMSGTVKFKRIP